MGRPRSKSSCWGLPIHFYYRDTNGLEVDVVIELLGGRWVGIEAKLDVVFVALGCDGELLTGETPRSWGLEEMFEWVRVGLAANGSRELFECARVDLPLLLCVR